jgi:hypothetical protein
MICQICDFFHPFCSTVAEPVEVAYSGPSSLRARTRLAAFAKSCNGPYGIYVLELVAGFSGVSLASARNNEDTASAAKAPSRPGTSKPPPRLRLGKQQQQQLRGLSWSILPKLPPPTTTSKGCPA